jgi:hypothetical protein
MQGRSRIQMKYKKGGHHFKSNKQKRKILHQYSHSSDCPMLITFLVHPFRIHFHLSFSLSNRPTNPQTAVCL